MDDFCLLEEHIFREAIIITDIIAWEMLQVD